jgi:uncharacterized protein
MRLTAIGLTLAAAWPAGAQVTQPPPTIQIQAEGRVRTPPDHVSINFEIRGEGGTADAATSMMVARRKAIEGGLAGVLGQAMEFQTGDLSLVPVHARGCDETNYGQKRLSSGDCAIVGYVASMSVTVETDAIKQAGTALGLVGRLEGSNVRLGGYTLFDDKAAKERATIAALANAHDKAEAMARAAGIKLGPVQRLQDTAFNDIVVTGDMVAVRAPAPPPPPPPPPPVKVDLSPRPIETMVRVSVVYLIDR